MGGALVVGLILGFVLAKMTAGKAEAQAAKAYEPQKEWWQLREQLTGTQAVILQFMDSKKEATISELQEKFAKTPDRELYYRLEQIVLMGFMMRGSKNQEVFYKLNPEYSETVEEDKTVFLTGQ